MSIPKFIWQTWKTNDIPDKWKESPASIKKFLPDYKYKLYTDEDNRDFVKKYFPDFLAKYDSYPYPIQRADAIRPMRLYIQGGIYMDLDMKIVDKVDHLFKNGDLFITQSANYPSLTNMLMCSKKKHPIWLEVIEAMKKGNKKWWNIIRHFNIMLSTGPGLIDKVFTKARWNYVIIPPVLVNAYGISDNENDIKNNVKKSIIVPLGGCSWHSWDSKLMTCYTNPYKQVLIILGIILLSIILIYIIYSLIVIYC